MVRNDMLVSHELKVNARPRWYIWWRQQWTKGKSHGKWIPFDDPAIFCGWIIWKIMIKTSESKNGFHKLRFPHIDSLRHTITKKNTPPQGVHKVNSLRGPGISSLLSLPVIREKWTPQSSDPKGFWKFHVVLHKLPNHQREAMEGWWWK